MEGKPNAWHINSMTDQSSISEPQTLREVSVHLEYLRNDIKEVKTLINDQSTHYINVDEFQPVKDMVDKHERSIENMKTFQDTLTGKMIGFGLAMGVVFTIISIAVQTVFHI